MYTRPRVEPISQQGTVESSPVAAFKGHTQWPEGGLGNFKAGRIVRGHIPFNKSAIIYTYECVCVCVCVNFDNGMRPAIYVTMVRVKNKL